MNNECPFNFSKIPSEFSVTVVNCEINFLEHVQVKVNLDFTRRGDLLLELRAPSGITSPLTRQRRIDNLTGYKNLTNWIITTLFNWGENPEGQWKLKIGNFDPAYKTTGKYTFFLHLKNNNHNNNSSLIMGIDNDFKV